MVRNYVRKTNRQQWSTESMQQAVESVVSETMGYRKASRQYNVPQTTLERYVQKRRNDASAKIDKTAGKYQCVFTAEQEAELADYLLNMQKRLFGLTQKECRKLAYQLAQRNKCKHSFDSDSEMAGEDWMFGFLSRHPELTLRKPEPTSGARAMGFNKVAVGQFFDLLKTLVDDKNLTGARIYNCDETGISCVPKQHSRIIAAKGQRQVGVLTSAERGTTVTAEICCSASGIYMPPMLIFPRKKKQQEFELGLPPGGWSEAYETGWMTSEIFCKWFKKFIEFSNATKDNPVLLLLDGHASHTKNLDVIDLARDNGVIILCFPPHCSHRLQPLDVSFMKPLSSYYEDEVRRWLRTNPGKVVTLWQISSLFGTAFINSANMKTAINGFEKTGIWPTNINVFKDDDFLPSEVTDIPMVEAVPPVNLPIHQPCILTSDAVAEDEIPISPHQSPTDKAEARKQTPDKETEPRPGCSWMPDPPGNSEETINSSRVSSFPASSPENILPIPKVKPGLKRVTRKRGKTAILTASPYKAELEEAANKATKTKEAKENRAKRKLLKDEEKKKKNDLKTLNKKPRRKHVELDEEEMIESSEEEDAPCLYCEDLYSKSSEGWASCIQCKKWAHNSCAGIDSDDDESALICEICQADP